MTNSHVMIYSRKLELVFSKEGGALVCAKLSKKKFLYMYVFTYFDFFIKSAI